MCLHVTSDSNHPKIINLTVFCFDYDRNFVIILLSLSYIAVVHIHNNTLVNQMIIDNFLFHTAI